MKLKDIGIMNEAVVNVPKHWIDMIIKEYMEPTKYAFMMEFSENDNEAEEIANEINYQSAQYKVHHSIFKK